MGQLLLLYNLQRFYLCGECLDRLKVEVVVEMQVVEVLAVDKQIKHVVALPANLQTHFNPVQLGGLKELGGLEGAEQIPESQQTGKVKKKILMKNRNLQIDLKGEEKRKQSLISKDAYLFF